MPSRFTRRSALTAGGAIFLGSVLPQHVAGSSTDHVVWRQAFDYGGTSPTVVDDTVYISGGDGGVVLHALDRITGDERWRFDPEDVTSAESTPTVVADTVYVGASKPAASPVYAIDAASGEERWHYETESQMISASPTRANDLVYFGTQQREIVAVSAEDGTLQWSFETGGMSRSCAIVVGDTLYIGGGDEFLYAIDAETGDEVWSFETGDDIIDLSPTYADGIVYTGCKDHHLYAIDAEAGEEEWRFDTGGPVYTTPTVADHMVLVASREGPLYALNATSGEPVWEGDPFEIPPLSSPTVVDGLVFTFSGRSESTLYAFDIQTGDVELELAFDGFPATSSPIVVDGTLYVGMMERDGPWEEDGALYAVDVPVDGSSEDSRVLLGTDGHHDTWTGDPDAAKQAVTTPADAGLGPGFGALAGAAGIAGAGYLWTRRHRSSDGSSH